MSKFTSVFVFVGMLVLGPALSAQNLLNDDFNDNSLNGSLWLTHTSPVDDPPGSGNGRWNTRSVTETNNRIEFGNRGYLYTNAEFDPFLINTLQVQGRWTINHTSDIVTTALRTNAIPTSNFANPDIGIGFSISGNGAGGTMSISRFNSGANTALQSTGVDVNAGDVFDFTISDDGNLLRFTIAEVGGDGTTASISANDTTMFANNHVLFFNREKFFTSDNYVAYLDSASISAVPEPDAMIGFVGVLVGMAYLLRRRRQKNCFVRV